MYGNIFITKRNVISKDQMTLKILSAVRKTFFRGEKSVAGRLKFFHWKIFFQLVVGKKNISDINHLSFWLNPCRNWIKKGTKLFYLHWKIWLQILFVRELFFFCDLLFGTGGFHRKYCFQQRNTIYFYFVAVTIIHKKMSLEIIKSLLEIMFIQQIFYKNSRQK